MSELTGDSKSVEGVSYSALSKKSWQSTFIKTEVLVVTPEICKQLINHHYFDVADVNCIIIDECHHAFGNNPLISICERIKVSTVPDAEKPLMLAMTASLVPSKKGDVKYLVAELEDNLNCKLLCYPEVLSDFRKLVPVPNCSLYRYAADNGSIVEEFFSPGRQSRSHFNRKMVDKIYSLSSESVQTCPTALLLNSSLRVKHAHFVFLIKKFARTLKMKCSDFEVLRDLHLDDNEDYTPVASESESGEVLQLQSELESEPTAAAAAAAAGFQTLLPPCRKLYYGITDINVALSQTAKLADNCGFICGLQALQVCLFSSVRSLLTNGMVYLRKIKKQITTKKFAYEYMYVC